MVINIIIRPVESSKGESMIKIVKFMLAILVVSLFTGCGSNPYMQVGTPEYKDNTKNIIGTWNIKSHKNGDSEFIGNQFESGTLELDFKTKRAKFTFVLDRKKLASDVKEWQQKWPDLQVSKYNVVVTADWELKEPDTLGKMMWGDLALIFKNLVTDVDIKGSGKNFKEGFYNFEKTKFLATEKLGMIGNFATKAAKKGPGGINPMIPGGYKVKFEGNNVLLTTTVTVIPSRTTVLTK
jgi:hypothetical protein